MRVHTLVCHADTPCTAVAAVRVRTHVARDGSLVLGYAVRGDPGRLRPGVAGDTGHDPELWRHTCFEVFLRAAGSLAYLEYNFTLAGGWWTYAFHRYREPAPLPPVPRPAVRGGPASGGLRLAATLAASALPAGPVLHLGLSVVIEDADGVLSYWALHHPPGRADFHHPDAFTLELHR